VNSFPPQWQDLGLFSSNHDRHVEIKNKRIGGYSDGLKRKPFGCLRKFGYLTLTCLSSSWSRPRSHAPRLTKDQSAYDSRHLRRGCSRRASHPLEYGPGNHPATEPATPASTFSRSELDTTRVATAKGFAKTTRKPGSGRRATPLVNVHSNPAPRLKRRVTTLRRCCRLKKLRSQSSSGERQQPALNGRNFTFLAQLGAGMQTPQADTRGNAARGIFRNGLRPRKTITCSMASITLQRRRLPQRNQLRHPARSTPSRSSRSRQRISAPNSAAQPARSERKHQVRNNSLTARPGSFSATINSMRDWFEDNNGTKKANCA